MQGMNRKQMMTLLACCAMVACSIGLCINAYGVFYTPLAEALSIGRAAATLHATVSGILTGLLSPLVVRFTRKRPVRGIACTGVLLTALSFVGMALAQNSAELLLCGVLRGVGNSCFYSPIITVILGNWFKKNQGAVVGAVMSFSGVAGAVLSPVLTRVIALAGYRAAALLGAALVTLTALPLCALFLHLTPAEADTVPYGQTVAAKASAPRLVNPFTVKAPVFFLLGGMSFLAVAVTGLTSHLSGYAESIGMGSTVGAWMISAVMVGNILSKFSSGLFSDKFGVIPTFAAMFLLALAGVLLLQVAGGTAALLAGSFLFGTIYAPSAVGLPSIVRLVYGDDQYGDAYAILSIIAVVAPSLSMTAIGALYDATGSYRAVLALFAVFTAAGVTLWCLAGAVAARHNTLPQTAPAPRPPALPGGAGSLARYGVPNLRHDKHNRESVEKT